MEFTSKYPRKNVEKYDLYPRKSVVNYNLNPRKNVQKALKYPRKSVIIRRNNKGAPNKMRLLFVFYNKLFSYRSLFLNRKALQVFSSK